MVIDSPEDQLEGPGVPRRAIPEAPRGDEPCKDPTSGKGNGSHPGRGVPLTLEREMLRLPS